MYISNLTQGSRREETKPKISRKKEITKIRKVKSKIETRNTVEKMSGL
jgi:hypothetical protein